MIKKFPLTPAQLAASLAPVALWVMVWSGMQSGEIRLLFEWEGLNLFLNRFRATIPLFAGYIALMVVLVNLYWRRPPEFNLAGPLGLTVVYGLAGAVAAAFSPLIPLALYWVGAYISVPLVLLAIMWGPDGADRILRLIRFNSIVVVGLVILFFFVALSQLDLAPQFFDSATWLNCRLVAPWFGLDFGPVDFLPLGDGLLRPTGVGRFSALAAIIAVTSVATGSWRVHGIQPRAFQVFWVVVFFGAVIVLWTTGARTAIVGFIGAIIVVGVLYGYFLRGQRFVIGGTAAVLLVGAALLTTGVPQDMLRGCITSSTYTAGTSLLRIAAPPVRGTAEPAIVPTQTPRFRVTAPPLQRPDATPKPTLARVRGTAEPPIVTTQTPRSGGISGQTPEPAPILRRGAEPAIVPTQTPRFRVTAPPLQRPDATPKPTLARVRGTAEPPIVTTQTPRSGGISGQTPEPAPILRRGFGPDEAPERPARPRSVSGSTLDLGPDVAPVRAARADQSSTVSSPVASLVPIDEPDGGFFAFSGRTVVWDAAWRSLKDSPLLGYGFHSDRLMLGTHMHNSYLHSLYQSGFIGVIPFVAALVLTWLLLLKAVINLRNLPVMHRHLVIQSAGIIVFFSARTITESTAAFFGIDWLLLAPIMIYLQTASNMQPQQEKEA